MPREPGIDAGQGPIRADRSPRSTSGDLARAGALVLFGFALARALGYVRVLAMSAIFGAGPELDAFYVAFRLPDLTLNLVATGAIASAVVPAVAPLLASGDRDEAARMSSFLLTLGGFAFAVFGLLVFVAAPIAVPLLAPGFGPGQAELAVQLTREMAPAPLLLGLGAMVSGILNSNRRFAPSVLGPVGYNVVTVLSAVLLSDRLGVHALSLGVVGGSAAYLAIQLLGARGMTLRYRPVLGRSTADMRRAVALLVPRALGLSTGQLQLLVLVAVASTLGPGAVTILIVAYTIFQIPAGTLGVPIGTVALPELSARHASGSDDPVGQLAAAGLRLALFLILPIAAVAVSLADLLVPLLFGYGSFAGPDAAAAAVVAALMFLGLPGETATALLARALYAVERTGETVLAAGIELFVVAVLAVTLASAFGLAGLGAALAIGASLEAVILGDAFRRRVLAFRPRAVLAAVLRTVPLAVVAGPVSAVVASAVLAVGPAPPDRFSEAVAVAVAATAGLLAYMGAAALLSRQEARATLALIRSATARSIPRPRRLGVERSGEG